MVYFGFEIKPNNILFEFVTEQAERFNSYDIAKNPFNNKLFVFDNFIVVKMFCVYPVPDIKLFYSFMFKRALKKKGYKGYIRKLSSEEVGDLLAENVPKRFNPMVY